MTDREIAESAAGPYHGALSKFLVRFTPTRVLALLAVVESAEEVVAAMGAQDLQDAVHGLAGSLDALDK